MTAPAYLLGDILGPMYAPFVYDRVGSYDLFVENPFWTVNSLASRLDMAYTTAQRAIDRLESLDIVSRVGEARRNRVYCAVDALDILEESPSLH